VGIEQSVTILPATRAASLYGVSTSVEDYYCAYGVNPAYRGRLEAAGMVVSGLGDEGEIRIVELPGQFFLATLFLPQTRSAPSSPHPLLAGFAAAVRRAAA
jgi:CTP synthase (UTP-ammonia lyase)